MKAYFYTTQANGNLRQTVLTSEKDTGEENQVLNIYEDVRYQTMEGFGGAITDAAGYVFSKMNKEQQKAMLQMYFGENEMNYGRVRIHMDSCDFCTHMYEADSDPEDEKLEKFSLSDTQRYIFPLLDAAQEAAGKKLKIMLSAWSPPAFMKTNSQRKHGGSLKEGFRKRWAEYLCRYLMEFQKRGYEVERISVQNEPKAVQEWDSCVYTPEEEKIFLRDYLVPEMQKNHLSHVEVFIWDHNKERMYERAREIIDDTTDSMIAGVAFHWYSGDHFEALQMVQERYPSKKMILSESCLEFAKYKKEAELENAQRLAHDMLGNLNSGMCAFYDWNILLDSAGGPNHTGNFCDAPYLFDISNEILEERKSLRYYWHFSHFIKPGAVRLGTTKYTDKLDFTAWENPDGTKAAIILNRSEEEIVFHIRIDGEMFTGKAAPESIMSGTLKKEER
jgi:glucosylceramidase